VFAGKDAINMALCLPMVRVIFIVINVYHSSFKYCFMQKKFSPAMLRQWVNNFTDNATLPFVTTSAIIELSELESFVAAIKKQHADSVRIYFLRFSPSDAPTDHSNVNGELAKGCKWWLASPALTQATIAMVPAINFKHDENFVCSADDIITSDGILTLYPGTIGIGTNMNPPSGKGKSLDTKK
jgi:hypothetical protein